MKKLLFSLLSLFVLSVYGKVTVSLEPKALLVGEQGALTIVSDEGQVQVEELPKVNDIRWFNPSQRSSTNIVNGKRSSSFTLTIPLSCAKQRRYSIPSFSYKVGGNTRKSPRFTVNVQKPQPIADKIFVKTYFNGVETVPKSIFSGEKVQYIIKVFVASSIHYGAVLPELTMNDVQFRDYSKYGRNYTNVAYTGKPESQLIKGNRFQTFTFVSEFTPLKSGEVTGEVKLSWQTVSENSKRTQDFFGRVTRQPTNYPLDFKFPEIEVLPLPPQKPSDGIFLGLIGNWNCSLKLNKDEVPAGEAVNLVLDVKGQGNIDQLNIPELKLDGFRLYGEPEVIKEKDATKTPSAQVSWVIVPLSETSLLPKMKFSIFDTGIKEYRQFNYQPTLKVTPGTVSVAPIVIHGQQGTEQIDTKDSLAAVDILFLKREGLDKLKIPLEQNVIWLLFPLLLMPLLLLVIYLINRHQSQLSTSSDYRRQHLAVKGKKFVFSVVKTANDDDLSDIVLKSVVPWLNDIMSMPKGTSAQELAEKLDDKELSEMIVNAESSKYMSGLTNKIDRAKLLKKLGKVISILVMFICCSNTFAGGDYPKALEAYEHGDYPGAKTIFMEHLNELKEEGTLDAALLYNLGNCATSQDKYGEALAWYEQARRLAPRDSDITENRNFIWKKIQSSELKAYESAGPIELLQRLAERLRPDEWLVMATLFWVVMFTSFGFNRIKQRGFSIGAVVSASLAIVCVWAYFSVKTALYEPHRQAIIVSDAPVYKLPLVNEDKVSFSAEVGKYAQVIEEREVFCLVKIDQAEGWVEKKTLKFVWE